MKKIIFVNNNMKVGGVQKSLYNLLWSIDTEREYDVTLLLFCKTGAYADKLPAGVKVIECTGPFRYLGRSQGEFGKHTKDALIRGFLALMSRIFGRHAALRLMSVFQPDLEGEYDCAISFLHNGRRKAFYGGTQDFVLKHIKAKKKIAFLHGDYKNCGADHKENNRMMEKFDIIAACSDGCREILELALPGIKGKCMTVRNFHVFDEIKSLADLDPIIYDSSVVNVVLVARLSHEKGIDRAITAASNSVKNGAYVRLHIVGNGAMLDELRHTASDMNISDIVCFYGEQSNPFRYMKNADLLLLTSYHEAAPMVIDEARALALPVLSTRTTSSTEMIEDEQCGWVCENTQEALNEALLELVSEKNKLRNMKIELSRKESNNDLAKTQFDDLMTD